MENPFNRFLKFSRLSAISACGTSNIAKKTPVSPITSLAVALSLSYQINSHTKYGKIRCFTMFIRIYGRENGTIHRREAGHPQDCFLPILLAYLLA